MAQQDYFPPPDPTWETVDPREAGFEPEKLAQAVRFAETNEFDWPRDLTNHPLNINKDEPPPLNRIIGPLRDRGGPNGLVVRGGRIAAQWGDVNRVDMTFSATKSYLAVCAGLAFDRGLIPDLKAPVRELVDDGGFEPPHNHRITWHHLLQQTSEWEGELWGKPDTLDRNRVLGLTGEAGPKGGPRELQEPGSFFEYNDVRVNRTALALLRVWQRPLPKVLKELIMDPIGASSTWEWHGYENSYLDLDGRRVQSVSGGGHWGGGLFINSLDQARFGLLLLQQGAWEGRRLLSREWLEMATTPGERNPDYGYMFWLNTTRNLAPGAPTESFFARGAGSNHVWVDPVHDLVVVARWLKEGGIDELSRLILAALE